MYVLENGGRRQIIIFIERRKRVKYNNNIEGREVGSGAECGGRLTYSFSGVKANFVEELAKTFRPAAANIVMTL